MGTLAALPFGIGPMELIIVLVLVLFGPKRLPQLGKSLGKTVKAIREGVEGGGDADADAEGEVADAKEAVQAKADDAADQSAKASEEE
jgi:sec-independent protein translocase protein TatA